MSKSGTFSPATSRTALLCYVNSLLRLKACLLSARKRCGLTSLDFITITALGGFRTATYRRRKSDVKIREDCSCESREWQARCPGQYVSLSRDYVALSCRPRCHRRFGRKRCRTEISSSVYIICYILQRIRIQILEGLRSSGTHESE